jgi:hypothetical protein
MINLDEDFKLEFDFEHELKLNEEKNFDESTEICRFYLKGFEIKINQTKEIVPKVTIALINT